ncbi:hypothetical protein [Streptomyces sp. NPDC088733]|uniref:hypothetical protein n=1 Tax=Streptomyces sp. NPDC088733 TaxID=3365880 RepID=UPI003817A2E5
MGISGDDFELEALLSINEEEAEGRKEPALEPEEELSVKKIEATGLRLARNERDFLRFEDRERPDRRTSRRSYFVERGSLDKVASEVSNYQESETYRGIVKADGSYIEYLLTNPGSFLPFGRLFERLKWNHARVDCGHEFTPNIIRTRQREVRPGFHVTSPTGDACIEISNISTIAAFKLSKGGRFARIDMVDYTLKVLLSAAPGVEAGTGTAQRIADSLLFELDAKHGLALSLIPWERGRVPGVARLDVATENTVSFPATSIPREVAALFGFAAEASDNPPFAFLSYYQVLEYYMPLTSKREALRRIRREMRDFAFDVANDASVLRILNAVERSKGLSEEDALKILVRDCAREDKLKEFFESEKTEKHFSSKGPIVGVPSVNLKATNETLATQAAKRVYALRNRIVHAKDDPKYAETPQLLPRSGEAYALVPDVLLARFLALETIADTQD